VKRKTTRAVSRAVPAIAGLDPARERRLYTRAEKAMPLRPSHRQRVIRSLRALGAPSIRGARRSRFSVAAVRFEATTVRRPPQIAIPAVYMRGGTSRALIFHAADLPAAPDARDAVFLAALGSPDPNRRQLDGLGGAMSSLSKIAIVGPPSRPDAAGSLSAGRPQQPHRVRP
jgi:hypothetical protein